jgi:hypothetical protein
MRERASAGNGLVLTVEEKIQLRIGEIAVEKSGWIFSCRDVRVQDKKEKKINIALEKDQRPATVDKAN